MSLLPSETVSQEQFPGRNFNYNSSGEIMWAIQKLEKLQFKTICDLQKHCAFINLTPAEVCISKHITYTTDNHS